MCYVANCIEYDIFRLWTALAKIQISLLVFRFSLTELVALADNQDKIISFYILERKTMSKTVQILSSPEIEMLLKFLWPDKPAGKDRCKCIRNYTTAILMLEAGLRVGEVAGLNISDLWYINAPKQVLIIRPEISKTGIERTIPISAHINAALETMGKFWWSSYLVEGLLPAFTSGPDNKRMTIRQIQRIIADASFLGFGRHSHPHELRHTFATRLMKQVNIRIVQELLGHVSITSTQIYTHPHSDDLKKAIDAL